MLISLGWVLATVLEVFMFLFDTTVYGLAIVCINVFNGIARMDFFSTDAGSEIYTSIARRLYGILGIIMIFFFAYQLVLLVINPDGDKKASTSMVRTTITSLIMIAFFPTLFKYMAEFQEHVLTEGTMTAIVLGTGASGGDSNASGRNTALIVYLSMFHPNDGGYNSIVNSDSYDSSGYPTPRTPEECVADTQKNGDPGANVETCELWINAYNDFVGGTSFGGITAFTINNDLIKTINEDGGSTYYAVIIVICGAVLIWFYASYAIDLGYRTFKLGFLQIISPAPLVMRIFPKTAQAFDKWKHELIRTYLEVFVRVFIVALVIAIIQKVPIIIVGIFQGLAMAGWCIPFGIVALIFGLLKFGKELPKLVKDIFDSGAGLLSGIDWKPGVGRRLEQGVDDVVGFGKNMAKRATKARTDSLRRLGKAVNLPLSAKRGAMKAAGGVTGAIKGAGAAIAANKPQGKWKTLKTAVAGASAGMKAGSAQGGTWTQGTKFSDMMSKTKAAGEVAGGKVETPSIAEAVKGFHDIFNAEGNNVKNMQVQQLSSDSTEMKNRIDEKFGITTAKGKIDAGEKTEIENYMKGVNEEGKDAKVYRMVKRDGFGNEIGFKTLTADSTEEMIAKIKAEHNEFRNSAIKKGYETHKNSTEAIAEELKTQSDIIRQTSALNVSKESLRDYIDTLGMSEKFLEDAGWDAARIENSVVHMKAENAKKDKQIEALRVSDDQLTLDLKAKDPAKYEGANGEAALAADLASARASIDAQIKALEDTKYSKAQLDAAERMSFDELNNYINSLQKEVEAGNVDAAKLANAHEVTSNMEKASKKLITVETLASEKKKKAAEEAAQAEKK